MKVSLIKDKEPKVFIYKNALDKMKQYIDACDKEIGWLATAVKSKNNYIIKDCFLFEQEVASTTCELTEEGLSNFAQEIIQLPNGVEIWNEIKCWGHSHVNMGVSPSTQDEKQFNWFMKNQDDFFIRIIGNKKEEFGISIIDLEKGIRYDEMSYSLVMNKEENDKITQLKKLIEKCKSEINDLLNTPEEVKNTIKDEIKKKVKPLVQKTHTKPYNSWGIWNENGNRIIVNNKSNYTKMTKEQIKAQDVFDEMTMYDVFETYIQMECGTALKSLIKTKLNDEGLLYLNELIEDFVNENWDSYAEYAYGDDFMIK